MNSATVKCCGRRVRVADNPFVQQELRYFRPEFKPYVVLPAVFAFGVASLIIFAVLMTSGGAEFREVYSSFSDRGAADVTVAYTPERTMHAPVYLMYEVSPYIGGNRNYRNSISREQLMGLPVSASTLKGECAPMDADDDPCGLVYATRFNDTFVVSAEDGHVLDHSADWRDISFPHEDKRYGADIVRRPDFGQLANWMRPSGLYVLRNTYMRIDENLEEGQAYTIAIKQHWPLSADVEGAYKALVLLEPGVVGAPNRVLTVMAGVAGGALVLAAAVLFLLYVLKPGSRRYDMFYPVTQQMGVKSCA